MAERYALLSSSSNPLQQSLIEEALKGEGIPFQVRERSGMAVILGAGSPLGFTETLVPEAQLQPAKDALCGNGIVCEVSGRLLRRSLEEIVKPLLNKTGGRDLERLAYFVGINNKETVRALFDATLEEEGGQGLLEDLFFQLARDASPALRIVTKAIATSATDAFAERFRAGLASADVELRERLIDVLPELPEKPWRLESLVAALRDGDAGIRTAAAEALFSLTGGNDFDYDPEAAPEEREAAIRKLIDES